MSSKDTIECEGQEFRYFGLFDNKALFTLLKLLAKKQKLLEDKVNKIDARTKGKDYSSHPPPQEIKEKIVYVPKDNTETAKEVNYDSSKQEKEKERDEFDNEPKKDDYSKKSTHNEKINEEKSETDYNNKKEDYGEKEDYDNKEDYDKKEDNDKKDYSNKENKEELSNKVNDEEKDLSNYSNNEDKKEDKEQNLQENLENNNNNAQENIQEKLDEGNKKDNDRDNLRDNHSIQMNNFQTSYDKTNPADDLDFGNEKNNTNNNEEDRISATRLSNERGGDNASVVGNSDLFGKIFKKLKDHEKKIGDLIKKSSNEHTILSKNIKNNSDNILKNSKRIDQLKQILDDLNNKFMNFQDEFEKVKVKVQDFNVYDLFQSQGDDGGNLDATKILVMNLENKVFKKFGLYDERNKKFDKDIFKLQEDLKNTVAQVDNLKVSNQKNSDSINELSDNINEKLPKHEHEIQDLRNNLDELTIKVNKGPDFSGLKNDLEKKIKEVERNLLKKIEELEAKIAEEAKEETTKGVGLSEGDLAMIKDMRKRISELDKFVTSMFNKMDFDEVKKKVDMLENEIPKKASKYEINEIKEKMKAMDEYMKDLNFKIDNLQLFTEKIRTEMATILKKIEYLSGEYAKLAFNKMGKDNSDSKGGPIIDMSKFIDVNTYNDNKKDVNNKFEKVRLGFEDLSREIEEILSRLSHTPSDKDFAQYQTVVKNLLDEFRLNCNKKYADKFETSKSIKFLETQIKTVSENYKKGDGADNWLLAKKPINGYCASCEAMIRGDLDKRTEYVPWNKYPSREEKSYRLGHGFSRMLQMVNEDIIRNAEKGYSSDEEKRPQKNNNEGAEKTYFVGANVKLPKVKKHNPININTSTEPNVYSVSSSPYEDGESLGSDRPHIMKVYRKTKGGSPQSALNYNGYKTNESQPIPTSTSNIENMRVTGSGKST